MLLTAAALAAVLSAAPASAATGGLTRCPGTFHMLDPDRVGGVPVAAGIHRLAVAGTITCSDAPRLLDELLQDWDGPLPAPWSVDRATGTLRRGAGADALRIESAPAPARRGACPQFTVLTDVRLGAARLAAGRYAMQVLSGTLPDDCVEAARELRTLIDAAPGLLFPWVAQDVRANAATFRSGATSTHGFRLRRAYAATAGGGSYPAAGAERCPLTFDVQNANRVGRLRVPAGPVRLTVFGGVTCATAVQQLKVFLGLPLGNLPSPWRARASTASFLRGSTGTSGFWLDVAYGY